MASGADDRVVTLAGGSRVGLLDGGDPGGWPVFVMHGTPGSRLGVEFAIAPARAAGVRVLAPDRPGIGGSDRGTRRTVADHAGWLAALADTLGLERFGIVGYSGGGPYALAAGARLGDRVDAVGLLAGAGPDDDGGSFSDRALAAMARRIPAAAAAALRASATVARRRPTSALRAWAKELDSSDRALLAAAGPPALDAFLEAFRQGPAGVVADYRAQARPWGFDLGEVDVPVVAYQGGSDRVVPQARTEALVARLPRADLTVIDGVGHLGLQAHVGALLSDLVRARPPAPRAVRSGTSCVTGGP